MSSSFSSSSVAAIPVAYFDSFTCIYLTYTSALHPITAHSNKNVFFSAILSSLDQHRDPYHVTQVTGCKI